MATGEHLSFTAKSNRVQGEKLFSIHRVVRNRHDLCFNFVRLTQ